MQELHDEIASTLKKDIVYFESLFDGSPKMEVIKAEKKEKAKILNSVVKSNHMVLQKPVDQIKGKIMFPDMVTMTNKTNLELKKIRVSKIGGFWDHVVTI
jgi:hypothetical protein